MAKIDIIPALEEHRAFMLDAFSREYADNGAHSSGIPPRVFLPKMEAILRADGWSALVATPEGMPSEILGFVVFHRLKSQAAWIHVKKIWRRKGIGAALWSATEISDTRINCAFLTPDMVKLTKGFGFFLRFRPYIPDALILAADEDFARMVTSVISEER